MIDLKVNLTGLNQMQAGMFKATDNAILSVLNASGRQLVSAIKADTPVGVSGRLRREIGRASCRERV